MVEYLAKEFGGQFEDAHDRATKTLTRKLQQGLENQKSRLPERSELCIVFDVSSVAMEGTQTEGGPGTGEWESAAEGVKNMESGALRALRALRA